MNNRITLAAAAICAAFALPAHAAVTADEAAKLKTTLTPLGGEKAGNADGSIPAWDGAGLKGYAGAKVGDIPAAPFADEKPAVQIGAKNAAQYAERLSDGTKALMQKYPDSFRIDVYPTHRTAAAPDYVIANTFANATRCKTKAGGLSVEGCQGGVPFPVPKEGIELYWNYMLRIESEAVEHGFKNIVVSADGSRALATRNDESWNFPYFYKDGSPEKWSGKYFLQRFNTTEPPFKAGESLVIHDSIDASEPRQAWQYLVGQRRVRRAPTVGYDTPDFVASGANYFDEVMGIFGAPDRYDWKLVGKKELYVPYNTNALVTAKVDAAFAKHHLNPDKLRWELHRVWVVEATVAPGKRHAVPKRRYYFDEDSWLLLLADGYDAEGKLWRTTQMLPFAVPAVPAVTVKPAAVFNLQAGTLSAVQFLNEETYRVVARKPESFYTGDAVAADNAR
ncbi:DUF1329 domain-containing protein [Derxia lacustris]|uniref:DUF1329 domain-containing protein n=1 Tax=Derxia lacustris TaxID=764842 RepID=UPI000A175160|nr:DUF1329 domain-containing protein [Derxia lacustris]